MLLLCVIDVFLRWPDEPRVLPGFREEMTEYFDSLVSLGRRVSEMLAESLLLPSDYFLQHLTRPLAILRLLRYMPEVSDVENGKFGAGAHSDYGLITILATDGTPGLQVEVAPDTWIDVPHIENTFVVRCDSCPNKNDS